MPFLHLCYLKSLTATYNSSSNAFHKGGAPTELDLNLSFDEAIQITRNNLYNEEGTVYHGKRTAIASGAFNMLEQAAGDAVESQLDGPSPATNLPSSTSGSTKGPAA